jgi:predicted ATP-grasp superfamily ATP-dependent carboligase
MTPAVVLSSHAMGLAVIRALGMMGVPVTSVYYGDSDMGFVSKYVTQQIRAPHPERQEREFISLLARHADPARRAVLIPADDATLMTVSKHKDLLESYYVVACTGASISEKFIDKKYTYELAAQIGIPAPKTLVPQSIEDVERCSTILGFPCLVKPRRSHQYFEVFKRKMVRVNTLDQMITEYLKALASGNEVMLQELIPGSDSEGANYNCFVWNEQPLVEFTARKLRLAPPGFGVPRVVVSKAIPEIIEPGRKLLRALGFHGYSCTEFKRDARDGVYKLMEVNGRHNRSGLLALRCGVNFPWIEYQHLLGQAVQLPSRFPEGVYWIDEFKDVTYSIQFAREERYSISDYVRPYLKPHIFAVYSLADPKPFFKRCIDLGRVALGKLAISPGSLWGISRPRSPRLPSPVETKPNEIA